MDEWIVVDDQVILSEKGKVMLGLRWLAFVHSNKVISKPRCTTPHDAIRDLRREQVETAAYKYKSSQDQVMVSRFGWSEKCWAEER